MAQRQLTLPGEVVKMSNKLARAHWPVSSVWEPRLVALVACRVRSDDEDFQEYEIPIKEIVQEKVGGSTYQHVAKVVDNLMGRVVTIKDKKDKGWTKYTLFSRCTLDAERNMLIARFDPGMKPHYLALNQHFTKYNLLEFLMLPSTYSQRLYEVLKSWSSEPEVTIRIDELREMLGVPTSLSKSFKDFRRRVLEKAHKDISKHTSLYYVWEPVKKVRKIEAIRFTFRKRALVAGTRKKAQDQAKDSRRNNQAFLDASACFKDRGPDCSQVKTKSAKCEVCKRLLQPQE